MSVDASGQVGPGHVGPGHVGPGHVGPGQTGPDQVGPGQVGPGKDPATRQVSGHAGEVAVAVAQAHGVRAMFTLSGAHVFPLYDGALKAPTPMPLVDVRHEQTAVFAAEATAKLTRTPGLAVLTAGPGVTNGVSAVTTAYFNGSPLLVVGGRAPAARWGTGSLQELDHPPLLAPVTKRSATIAGPDQVAADMDDALRLATSPHRGPVFLDIAMDHLFSEASAEVPVAGTAASQAAAEPDGDALDRAAAALAAARHPVLVLGSDVWTGSAETAAVALVEDLGLPVVPNGMGRGILPPTHPLLVTRARGKAFGGADLVLVVGTPLDFRLGYGQFGGTTSGGGLFGGGSSTGGAGVVHIVDDPAGLAAHVSLVAGVAGDLSLALEGLRARVARTGLHADAAAWGAGLRTAHEVALAGDAALLASDSDPIHPARIYGELARVLEPDAVVIGDGGDFVSFAGRFVEPSRPGGWLDPGPYGCLGTGLGYAMAARLARPSSQVVLLLGDGAAGFSLMDVDSLVRHRLPVLIVVGNNGVWGLEKGPMQMLFGYTAATDLQPQTRYDQVVKALGGDGELVTSPSGLGAALRRGLDATVPYCVNVITDPDAAYPRSTTGI